MAVVSVEIEELIPILRQVGGFSSEEELAKALGVSRVTFNAWKKGSVNMNAKTEHKLRAAMSKNKNWGIQLGKVSGSRIEIIQNSPDDKLDQEKDIVYELLIKEIKTLREELTKYKTKKK